MIFLTGFLTGVGFTAFCVAMLAAYLVRDDDD